MSLVRKLNRVNRLIKIAMVGAETGGGEREKKPRGDDYNNPAGRK